MHTSPTPHPLQVVGREYDSLELDGGGDLEAYETVYALLNHLSPSYPSSFQHALADKLEGLEQGPNPTSTTDDGSSQVSVLLVVIVNFYQPTSYPLVFAHFSSSSPHSLQTETASKFFTSTINTCLCTLTVSVILAPHYWRRRNILYVARDKTRLSHCVYLVHD